jgi:hypothetical protein
MAAVWRLASVPSSSLLTGLAIVLTAATAHAGKTCIVTGTDVSMSKVTIAARSGPFEVRVAHVAATVTADRTATIEVAGVIGFKGVVTQKIWYQLKRGFTVGQVTLTPGANFVGDHAVGDQMFGSAVLHASDVMEGEDKPPDEAASQIAVHCADLSLDWSGDRTDATIASTGTTYVTRNTSSLVLHREPKDEAAGVTVATSCEGEGCLFFESIARRGDWIELGVANEGVAVVGWVRDSTVKRAPASAGFGFTYGCTGDHGGGTVMYGDPPTMKHHTVRLDPGAAIYAAPDGEVWANVQQPFEIDVVYANGDRWAELRALPGVDLGATPSYVPVSSLRAPAH